MSYIGCHKMVKTRTYCVSSLKNMHIFQIDANFFDLLRKIFLEKP